jgi:hypothetical protein
VLENKTKPTCFQPIMRQSPAMRIKIILQVIYGENKIMKEKKKKKTLSFPVNWQAT